MNNNNYYLFLSVVAELVENLLFEDYTVVDTIDELWMITCGAVECYWVIEQTVGA